MKRVLWLTNIPSPYRVKFFNELGKHCCLTVLFEKAFSDERDNNWKDYTFNTFEGVVLKGRTTDVDKAFSLETFKYINNSKRDIIVVSNPATPTGVAAILYMRFKGIPYIVESDGAFPVVKKGFKEFLKRFLYKGAKACFTTSEVGKVYFAKYGVRRDDIYKYPFTSLAESEIPELPTVEEKQTIRKLLGIGEQIMIISVGQIIHRKGYDVLMEAATKIDKAIGIYIIGGKAPDDYVEYCKQHNLMNVHFHDFMPPKKLREWYLAADLFVLPTREDIWGLVINEALACGLPVVTTTRCVAGLEMVSEKNGRLVESGNAALLVSAIRDLMASDTFTQIPSISRKTALQYTIEKMSERHIGLFNLLY